MTQRVVTQGAVTQRVVTKVAVTQGPVTRRVATQGALLPKISPSSTRCYPGFMDFSIMITEKISEKNDNMKKIKKIFIVGKYT